MQEINYQATKWSGEDLDSFPAFNHAPGIIFNKDEVGVLPEEHFLQEVISKKSAKHDLSLGYGKSQEEKIQWFMRF
ncbi:MAG: hypothetical protein AAGA18_07855 [Verrucomicrobiota bacterium]